jgi:ADP-heptose:LPS heptosyltransferase
VDRVLLYRKLPGWPLSIVQLASYRPDVALLPKGHPAFTESLVLAICGARWRVGLSHPNLDRLLTHPVEHDWENEHRTTAFSRLLAPFGVDPASVRRRPHIGRDEEAEAWARRIANSKAVGRPLLTINLSASRGTRRWPIARWQQFITLLLKEYPGATILALSSPADHHQCVYLAETFFQVHTIATRSFLEAVSLVAQSDLLVTVDTGIVQGAAARGVPMVVLYNGDHEVYIRFAPESVPHRALLAPRGQPVAAIQERDVLRETLRMLQRFRRDRGA